MYKEVIFQFCFNMDSFEKAKKIDGISSFSDSSKVLDEYGFRGLEILGSGKDGVTFKAIKDNKLFVCKVLKQYAKQYLEVTKKVILKLESTKSKIIYPDIIDDKVLVRPYLPLEEVNTSPYKYLNFLVDLCDLQIELLRINIVYWDHGFDRHINYMYNNEGLVLVDFGGNGFLFTNPIEVPNIKGRRQNLLFFNNLFAQCQLLLHLNYVALGKRFKDPYPSISQVASKPDLEKIAEFATKLLNGSYLSGIQRHILNSDLKTEEGWNHIKDWCMGRLEKNNDFLHEPADIQIVKKVKDQIIVNGYQSYKIINNIVIPLDKGGSGLWSSKKKYDIVKTALNLSSNKFKISSVLDLGCNLGMHSFTSSLEFKVPEVTGVDYNDKYIDICKKITTSLGVKSKITFICKRFEQVDEIADVIILMGLIHHIYHRTENFGDLNEIIRKIRRLTRKCAIIEFPDETDQKAIKWTNMIGRVKKDAYTKSLFNKALNTYFSQVDTVGEIKGSRTTFICYV